MSIPAKRDSGLEREATTYLEVLFTPAEFERLPQRDLKQTVCVVFDILRATSSMITALASGAEAIQPVGEIQEALAVRQRRADVLLAGERNGLRIRADLANGVEFDFGNSPREFSPQAVRGRTIVMTTPNGTRALRSCLRAKKVLVGSFLGLQAVTDWILRERPERLLLVCSGTHDEAAYEDTLAAGALCDLIWPRYETGPIADSAVIARDAYQCVAADLLKAIRRARNGRRLLSIPELAADVPFCLQRDTTGLLAAFSPDALIRPIQ